MKTVKYAQSTLNREFKEIRKMKDCLIYKTRKEESYLIPNPLTTENEIIDITIDEFNNVVLAFISSEDGTPKLKYELK